MDTSSFITSLGTSFAIFLVLLLLYSWMSRLPGNKMVYYPNSVRKGMDPWGGRRGKKNPFGWVREAVVASEEEIISMAGVDFATYLVFLKTALGILVLSGIVLLPVLLPVAGTDNNLSQLATAKDANQVTTFNSLDKLTMGNIKVKSQSITTWTEKSKRLWAFLVGTWWVTLATYLMLWRGYKHMLDLRAMAKSTSVVKPEDYTILVRDIPPVPQGQTRQEQVDSYFSRLYPDHFYKSMVITDNKQAEEARAEVMKYKNELAHAEAELEEESNQNNNDQTEETRPIPRRRRRRGLLSLISSGGEEPLDLAINHYKTKINKKLSKLLEEQQNTLEHRQQAAALVFFNSRRVAVMASQTLHSQIGSWTVCEAPEPRQLIWSNLGRTSSEIQVRTTIVSSIVFLTVAFYMIPITFLSALSTLENLKKLLPFLKPVINQPVLRTVLEAYLPQLALFLFLALLPRLLKFLSRTEGRLCKSDVVEASSVKHYYFIIFNVFLGVTLSGTLIRSVKAIVDSPARIVELLGGSLPGSATFFLTFVALKFFIGYGMELSRLGKVAMFRFRSHFFLKTEDELRRAWAPGDFRYATKVPNDMLTVTICLCYSVIAPLIVPFGILYCGLGWLIARNQALRVYIPSYESNGRMWPHMFRRIMASLIIYQITTIGYFGIKKFYYAFFLVPLPVISLIFGFICRNRFDAAFYRTPLDVVCRGSKDESSDMEAICQAYVPPSLSFEIPDRIRRASERNGDGKEKDVEEGRDGDRDRDPTDEDESRNDRQSHTRSRFTRSGTTDYDL